MEENDYIELHTLLAKLDVVIGREFLYYDSLSDSYKKTLKNLSKAVTTIRKNLIVRVDEEKEFKDTVKKLLKEE